MSNDPKLGVLKDADTVLAALAEGGLLFLSDPKRPSAFQLLTGELPRGSWWSHPQANAVYAILQEVEHHGDVLLAKLLGGKVTLVHRALWPALLTVVTAREPWQLEGLPPVSAQGLAAFDEAEAAGHEPPTLSRTVSKELEARLLAQAESVHVESGKHETRLRSWKSWAASVGCAWPPAVSAADVQTAKRTLETAAARLGPPPPELPWKA
jgi:hypothetical protein